MGDERDLDHGVVLMLENGVIAGVSGDPSTVLPGSVADSVGSSLLNIVHPVDRSRLAEWLDHRVGASPPFRRAQSDASLRWLRMVAVEPGPGHGEGQVYVEDVSEAELEALRRHRLTTILAREGGEEFLDRVPRIAAEMVGATHGVLAEVHGPVAVVRSAYGDGLPAPGAAVAISGDPIEGAVVARSLRTFEDDLQSRFPDASFAAAVDARSGAVVPAWIDDSNEVEAALVVLSGEPHAYSLEDGELLELLAARIGRVLDRGVRRVGGGRTNDPVHFSPKMLELAARGVSNAFGNLLASIGLNLELAAADPDVGARARKQLERALESVQSGRWLVRAFDLVTASEVIGRRVVAIERSVEMVASLLRLCVDGFSVETKISDNLPAVWGTEQLVVGVLLQYLFPISELVRPQSGVTIEVSCCESDGVAGWVEVVLSARLDVDADRDDGALAEALEAAARIVDELGARADVSLEDPDVRVTLHLPAVRERVVT